jgi:hypothetical protein
MLTLSLARARILWRLYFSLSGAKNGSETDEHWGPERDGSLASLWRSKLCAHARPSQRFVRVVGAANNAGSEATGRASIGSHSTLEHARAARHRCASTYRPRSGLEPNTGAAKRRRE